MAEDFDIQAEDYLRYATAVGSTRVCPMCGNNHWELNSEADGRSYSLIAMKRENPQIFDANVAWLLILLCTKCSYLVPILREPVRKWLAANP